MAVPAPPPPAVPPFKLTHTKVGPRRVYYGGRHLRMRFRFQGPSPTVLRVQIQRRSGRVLRRWDLAGARPPGPIRVQWNGLTRRRHVPADGRYRVMAGQRGRALHRAGSFLLHGHFYPVRGPHSFRGAVGRFGAPRSGGRTHEGFDTLAACGTPVASVRSGKVTRRRYDPVLYGNYVIVRSSRERRSYMYAHLAHPGKVRAGRHVRTGQRIGRVGASGNARAQGCQLHFEAIGPGGPFDPEPLLRRWDRWS